MNLLPSVKFTLRQTWQAGRKLFLLYVVSQTVIAFTWVIDLLVYKEVIDAASGEETILGLSIFGVILFLLMYNLVRKVLESFSYYTWTLLETKQVIDLNKKFVDKIASLDLSTFEEANNIGLTQRAFNRFQFQYKYYLKAIVEVFTSLIKVSISVLIFFIASPLIALLIIIANLIPILVRKKLAYGVFLIYRADDETKRRFGYVSNTLIERETLPEIKLHQAFGFFKEKIVKIYKQYMGNQLKIEKKYQIYNTLAEFLPIFSIFIFSLFIAWQLHQGTIGSGTFVFLFINVFAFSGALNTMGQNWGHLHADSLFMKDAIEFFDLKPKISFLVISKDKKQNFLTKIEKPSIKIENVSFRYPKGESLVLKNINLEIPFGQNIALIGENGAGKTTLVKLLLRMYDPTEGKILINNISLKELPEEILFGLYSTLFQSFGKFYLTIRENLEMAAGRKLAKEEAISYLKFSNAWRFIERTKYKLDQQLGPEYKEGIDLSGGEWQRLAIARAYAKKAPILILDEPTSAIDAKSEMEIFDRLNKEMKENTLFFISHRFSTIKDAERIVVLDKGKIIEDGTHGVLMRENGKYAKLYTIQAERYLKRKKKWMIES